MRAFHSLLQRRSACLGNCIPELRRTKVDVVDAEQVHVFHVPREGCPPHAKVEVRGINSRQTFVGGWQESRQRRREVGDVPGRSLLGEERTWAVDKTFTALQPH